MTDEKGIECPSCGCRHLFVTHTEPIGDNTIRRRRQCRHCRHRFVTYENIRPPEPRQPRRFFNRGP